MYTSRILAILQRLLVCPLLLVPRARIVYSDQHGMDQITNTEGTVATVICDAGSKLVGPGSAVCSNGEWSVGDIGQCKPLGEFLCDAGAIKAHCCPLVIQPVKTT